MSTRRDQGGEGARHRLPAIIVVVNRSLSLAAGGMVGILMFLVFADVVGRYIFNKPIFGAYELVEVLMGWVIFAGMPLVSRAQQHISVDFVSGFLPQHLKPLQEIVVNFICSVTALLMAWRIWLYGERLIRVNETTMELQIPRGMIAQIMAVMLALAGLAFFLNLWDSIKTLKSKVERE